LNTSNVPEPLEPAGTITTSWRDSARASRYYVATGRPFSLWVVVPYQGKLHLANGAVSSYYEFSQSDSAPPWDDATWKSQVKKPLATQTPAPWLGEAVHPLTPEP
jgi:hypothetical protein